MGRADPAGSLDVIEAFGGQDFYADGWVIRDDGEIVVMIFYVTRTHCGQTEKHEILRIHMRGSGWHMCHASAQQRSSERRDKRGH